MGVGRYQSVGAVGLGNSPQRRASILSRETDDEVVESVTEPVTPEFDVRDAESTLSPQAASTRATTAHVVI